MKTIAVIVMLLVAGCCHVPQLSVDCLPGEKMVTTHTRLTDKKVNLLVECIPAGSAEISPWIRREEK